MIIMCIVAYGSVLYAAVLTGGVGPIVSALSRKYGKRPQLLIASVFGLLGTIIGSAAYSYEGLLAGRIIQGGSMYARIPAVTTEQY
jgi:predicted MFS family arabinose efflux permease